MRKLQLVVKQTLDSTLEEPQVLYPKKSHARKGMRTAFEVHRCKAIGGYCQSAAFLRLGMIHSHLHGEYSSSTKTCK